MLPALELFKTRYIKMFGKEPPVSRETQVILALMDEYNRQHFHDRNSLRADMKSALPKRPGGVHEPERGGRESA